jgi:hypothetical protein
MCDLNFFLFNLPKYDGGVACVGPHQDVRVVVHVHVQAAAQ